MEYRLEDALETTFSCLVNNLIAQNISISAMESCTSGLFATMLTNTSGASEIFKGSFVTYSNEAKIKCGVSAECIEKHGVYSKETALEMALACQNVYGSILGVGITGVLDRTDPSNPTTDHKVYYAIVWKNGYAFAGCIDEIPEELTDRMDRKRYVVWTIGEHLVTLLDINAILK